MFPNRRAAGWSARFPGCEGLAQRWPGTARSQTQSLAHLGVEQNRGLDGPQNQQFCDLVTDLTQMWMEWWEKKSLEEQLGMVKRTRELFWIAEQWYSISISWLIHMNSPHSWDTKNRIHQAAAVHLGGGLRLNGALQLTAAWGGTGEPLMLPLVVRTFSPEFSPHVSKCVNLGRFPGNDQLGLDVSCFYQPWFSC